jgi:hypothetical protein
VEGVVMVGSPARGLGPAVDDGVDGGAEEVGGSVGAAAAWAGSQPSWKNSSPVNCSGAVCSVEHLDHRVAHGAGLASVAAPAVELDAPGGGGRAALHRRVDADAGDAVQGDGGQLRRSGSFSQWSRSPTRSVSGVESSSAAVSSSSMAAMAATPSRPAWRPAWRRGARWRRPAPAAGPRPRPAPWLGGLLRGAGGGLGVPGGGTRGEAGARRLVFVAELLLDRLRQRAGAGEHLDEGSRSCAARWLCAAELGADPAGALQRAGEVRAPAFAPGLASNGCRAALPTRRSTPLAWSS